VQQTRPVGFDNFFEALSRGRYVDNLRRKIS
jgi:hypothetical protein